jgi:RNA polymerase sigma-70 factor (ECF subfamily)
MTQEPGDERLSRISTRWSLLCEAHSGAEAATTAQLRLLEQYGGAVYRYLLGALRSPEAAEELSQEFALRFIRGDFRGADPGKGRFRDYVKTVLFRLVANYHKRRQAEPRPLPADPAAPAPQPDDLDQEFLEAWRWELLDRAWEALAEAERKTGQPLYAVLRHRTEHPDAETTSAQMAAEFSARLSRRFTADGIRKTLQRAREKFAQLLVEDVARSLGKPTPQQLEQELRDLGLWSYCTDALDRRG